MNLADAVSTNFVLKNANILDIIKTLHNSCRFLAFCDYEVRFKKPVFETVT